MNTKKTLRIAAGASAAVLLGVSALGYSSYSKEEVPQSEPEAKQIVYNEETIDEDTLKGIVGDLSATEKAIDKDETVFLMTGADGSVDKVVVSEHLINADGTAELKDTSELKDIVNVKGDETFTQTGDKITWEAGGNDIYYQGTASEQLPLTQKVSYKLNGKDISPEDLAGKSGKVTIRFDYENHTKYTGVANGEKYTVTVPLAAVTCIVIPDGWTNVTAENGKVISTGSLDLLVGYCMPGLQESLDIEDKDLTEDVELPEYVEFTADVDNFELSTCMTVVTGAGDVMSAEGIDLSELEDSLNQLDEASLQLTDGSQELADGLDSLKKELPAFSAGMRSLSDGTVALQDGINQLSGSVPALEEGANNLKVGSDQIYNGSNLLVAGYTGDGTAANPGLVKGAKNVADGAAQVSQGVDALATSLGAFSDATAVAAKKQAMIDAQINSNAQLLGLLSQLSGGAITNVTLSNFSQTVSVLQAASANPDPNLDPYRESIAQALAGMYQLQGAFSALDQVAATLGSQENMQKIGALQQGSKDLAAGASAVSDGVQKEYEGTVTLQSGIGQLNEGCTLLADKVPALTDGANKLQAGSSAVAAGANKLNTATGQIVDGVDKLDAGSHELADGMTQFNEEGIQKILESYNGDIKPLVDRLQVVMDAGESYQNYAGIADGETGRVKFIYKLTPIK